MGAGAQLEYELGAPVTATISAFSAGTLLGSFTETLNGGTAGDNTATFVGVLSSSANIDEIRITSVGGLFMDTLSLNTSSGPPPSVPEPATLGLLGLGFVGLGFARRRKLS